MEKFNLEFKEKDGGFRFKFDSEQSPFSIGFTDLVEVDKDALPVYEGETVVIPDAHNETVLQTENKHLMENITVRKVPFFLTSNSTGETVYIASEV